jgi:hypothetical protein
MRFARGNQNFLIGVFLLFLLAVLAGPNVAPRLVSQLIPEFDEGVPCDRLRQSSDRGQHQSLLGRNASNPLDLRVRAGPLPSDGAGSLVIVVTITNQTLGSVPIVFNRNQIPIGDNGTTGLGLTFSQTPQLIVGANRDPDPATFPENNIYLLSPRQSCVYRVEFPAGNVLPDPNLNSGTAQVRAFYRGVSPGQVTQTANATPIYPDQGLWTGFIQSEPEVIRRAGQ